MTGDDRRSAGQDDRLRRAYEEGFAAARRGEEAAPGCTVTDEGGAWLRGYVEGAASREGGDPDPRYNEHEVD